MDCAYNIRHSEYHLYGILWRKSTAPPQVSYEDDEEDKEMDEIEMRPSSDLEMRSSRRISATPDNVPALNPLQSSK